MFHWQLQDFQTGDKIEAPWDSTVSSSTYARKNRAFSPRAFRPPPGMRSIAQLVSTIGPTWGDYVAMLDNEAAYLGNLGDNVTDVSQLWQFAIMQADGLSPMPVLSDATDISVPSAGLALEFTREYANSITSRNTFGPLGYGWTDNWQYSLAVASDGTVTVTMPSGQERVFQPDSRYTDSTSPSPATPAPWQPSPAARPAARQLPLAGSRRHRRVFNSNGTLDYIQDTQGNRITAGYTGGRLTSLTSSSGGSLTIALQRGGLISSVTSSAGQTVAYGYDATQSAISRP